MERPPDHSEHPGARVRVVVLRGGLDEDSFSRAVSQATGTDPEPLGTVEGVFRSGKVAEVAAELLQATFPDRVVTIEEWSERHRVTVRFKP